MVGFSESVWFAMYDTSGMGANVIFQECMVGKYDTSGMWEHVFIKSKLHKLKSNIL